MNRTFTPVKPATALKSVFLFFVFTALMGNFGWGQCTNTSSWGSAAAPSSGTITIKTDQYEGEYNTISSVAAATVYTSEINNAGDYITVRQGSSGGTLIAFGPTPLTWTSTTADTYYIHYNTNSSCGTASVNRTSKLTYVGTACTATITLGSNSVAAANICAGTTKVPLQSFSLAVAAGCNGNLTNVGFTTTGTYVQADISKYQLWYNTSNNLAGATQVGTDLASAGGAGARTFAAFTSPTLTAGSTYYFWITADVTATATNNNTIAVNAMLTSDLTSTSTKVLGSNAASGTQTIIGLPTTASNTSTQSICGGSANLSGNVPTFGTGAWTVFSGPSTSSTQFANTSINNTIFTPAGGAGSYVVRWTISNSCTSTSADATISVSTSAPSCATMTAPANGATGQLVPGVTLTWNAVAGASGYDVYLQAGTNPPTTLVSSNQAGTSYATGPLNPSTTYYWYVVPRNICGAASGCSASAFSFVTGTCTSDIYVTATVGTLTGSYTTLKGAFDKINDGTHKGVISISVGRNTTETATAALNASGTGAPSSSYTSVLIQPCGGSFTITGSLAGVPIINLNGADNVTINGINSGGNMLTIANTNVSAGSGAIQFINDATNNIVRNSNIYSSNISTTSGTIAFSTTTGTTGNDNNTIEYCSIYDGATAPYVGIYSSGTTTSTTHYNSNNTISNNKIYNFLNPAGNEGITAPSGGNFFTGTDYGIKIASGNTSWTISNNSLYRINTTAYTNTTFDATHFGIYVSTDGDGFNVSDNYIGGSGANCSGTPWTLNGTTALSNYRGIQMKTGNTAVSTVSGNVVANILFKTSAAGTSYGAPFMGIHLNGNFAVTGNKVGDHAYGLIEVACISSNSDFNGIFYYNEAVSGPALWTVTGNTVANIKNVNTSGNASFYGIRCFSKECSINMTCSNNIVGGSVANSILLSGTASSWVHGIFVSGLTSAIVSGNNS